MKIKDILECKETLIKLNTISGLPSVVAYRIGKNIKAIDTEMQEYDEVRVKLLKDVALKDENGEPIINKETNNYDIPQDQLQKIIQEIDNLQNEEISIDIKKVSIEDISQAGLSPKELMSIEFMLED
ncbi:hypothetical protein DWX89_03175 [Coprobacillus sp. AF21-8LB]|nr:hypothetical protein DWX89_03175 [Coprobacillus sp. AF21-8LB]